MEKITTIKASDYINEMKLADKDCSERMEKESKKLDYAVLVMKLRESLGLTQKEFARLVNKPQSTLARIENGNANPTIKTLETIAELSGKKLVMSFKYLKPCNYTTIHPVVIGIIGLNNRPINTQKVRNLS